MNACLSGMVGLRFLGSSVGFPSVAVIMCVGIFMPTHLSPALGQGDLTRSPSTSARSGLDILKEKEPQGGLLNSVASACILSDQGQLCRRRKSHRGKEEPCRQQAGSKLRGLWHVGTAHPVECAF